MILLRNNSNSFNQLICEYFESLIDDDSKPKTPIHDVIETDSEFNIELILAGIKKENINIDVNENVLTINAERKLNNDVKYNRKETYFGQYKRSFNLPDYIDVDSISASYIDGILKVIVPKSNKTKVEKKIINID